MFEANVNSMRQPFQIHSKIVTLPNTDANAFWQTKHVGNNVKQLPKLQIFNIWNFKLHLFCFPIINVPQKLKTG